MSSRSMDKRPGGGSRAAPSIHIVQGDQRVTTDPATVLSTLLGSCVAACLHDPIAQVGGMNHFLLPGDMAAGAEERFGVHAMELLINAMVARGAASRRLEAKIFGGANLNMGLKDVGRLNAAFAQQFLRREGITIVAECLGGRLGRRVQFWPVSGRARRSFMPATDQAIRAIPTHKPVAESAGSLELF